MGKVLIGSSDVGSVSIELFIMVFFALLGVFLLRLIVGSGGQSDGPPPGIMMPPPGPMMPPPGPSPYDANYAPIPMTGYYAMPPPRRGKPKVIKRKVIILPEKIVRKHTRRKRRLRT